MDTLMLCDFLLIGIADDLITGRNKKTVEGYVVINFEVTSSSNFPDIKQITS